MIICPECRRELLSESCETPGCAWKQQWIGSIPVYLCEQEFGLLNVDRYALNYEELAVKNLESSNLDPLYLQYQAENSIKYLDSSDISGKNVCELGAGQGKLTKLLAEAGAGSVSCIDIAPSYLENLPKYDNVHPFLANGENLPFADEFDLIVSTDVMEHVVHVSSYLYCLNQAARPGGKILIRVPYRENLIKYSKHIGFEYDFGHLRSFNKQLLKEMLEGAGFMPTKWKIDGFGLGMPNEFWKKTPRRWNSFKRIRQYLWENMNDPIAVTKWPSSFARILMKPNELVVVARKVCQVDKIEPKGFQLKRLS